MYGLKVNPAGPGPFTFPLVKGEVLIGRGPTSDLILPDPKVSRKHALLHERPQGVFLKDLGSFNGTYVNGRRIDEVRLKDQDHIILGASELIFLSNLERTEERPDRGASPAGDFEQTLTLSRAAAGQVTPPGPPSKPGMILEGQTVIQKIRPLSDSDIDAGKNYLLTIKPPAGPAVTYPLDESEIMIGRSPSCQIIVNDRLLSRKHALIRKTAEGLVIEDLNSSNGTYVNDERIQSRQIRAGDRIRMGTSILTLETDSPVSFNDETALISPKQQVRYPEPFNLENFSSLFMGENSLQILVAHPDSFRIAHLLRLLKKAGAVLYEITRKEEVLDFVQETLPDLILLSPSLNRSLDLCLELRDRKSEVPVLVLMENQEWEEVLPFIKAGADDFLLKEEPYELFLKLQKLVELYRLRRRQAEGRAEREPQPPLLKEQSSAEVKTRETGAAVPGGKEIQKDFFLLLLSRASTRIGDGFLRIISILLVAAKSKDPMIAGLVLVFRYICEILINAISGPFIDKIRIRHSLMAADLIRTILSLMIIGAVLLEFSYAVYLVLSFLGDFVFIFFKPASDKMVKVTFPVKEGTKVLSRVDAVNHISNIGGYALASVVAGWLGLRAAVFLGPAFFFFSFLMVSRLRLAGESIIDYKKVRKKSYWASQREGLKYTWGNKPLRLLLMGRSLVAVGRGSFTVLSVVYLANIAKGLTAYGYFESAQSAGKVVVTALVIPFFFAYRSTFFLTGVSLIVIGLSFFGFNLVYDVFLACLVGAMVGAGQASEAVGIDSILNRYSEAHIQGRAKSTTSFGSRVFGLAAIGVVYLLVTTFHVSAHTLFGWLGIFPLLGSVVFFLGWKAEKEEVMNHSSERGDHVQ